MNNYLGIDTSNYTTSCAVYNSDDGSFVQCKKLLPVKPGEKGLRQSDAVFHHTVQLPELIEQLVSETGNSVSAIGVSVSPRTEKGSYMPCFLTGISVARSLAAFKNLPLYEFSHQQGHIAAVVSSSESSDLLKKQFIAFHLSGGTTEAVLVTPDNENIIKTEIIAQSLDLKAGQAIDRVGVMMGLQFPCGAEIDRLSLLSDIDYKIRPSMKNADCSLSGIENKCSKMFTDGESNVNIAKFCLQSIIAAVDKMCMNCLSQYGDLPVVFSGGVSSNTLMQKYFTEKYNAVFSTPSFSADNAAGIAYLAAVKNKR